MFWIVLQNNNLRTFWGWFVIKHPINKNSISLTSEIVCSYMRVFTAFRLGDLCICAIYCDTDTHCVTQSTYANQCLSRDTHYTLYKWKRWRCFGTIFSIRMNLFFRKVSSYKQDSVWSWFICFCYTICMIFVDGLTFSLGVFFPVLMDSFNESRERTGKLNITIIVVKSARIGRSASNV